MRAAVISSSYKLIQSRLLQRHLCPVLFACKTGKLRKDILKDNIQ